jgi:thymidylate synthase
LSIFAPPQLRFKLGEAFPLLTTKRVFFRGVVEELLWFLRGDTNAKTLQDKDIHIWDGNASKQFLASVGLGHREEGDLGPVYGFQWRHFGAKYETCHSDYNGKGVDQLKDVIEKILTKPYDRRIIISAWNPADIPIMALPPCHMFCQFYVSCPENKPKLSCLMYQRSVDVGLGLPFNIASYALLTCLLAHVCDMDAGEFVHVSGDAHVYKDHVEPLKEQLTRIPNTFPELRINVPRGGGLEALMKIKYDDVELVGYKPHGKISMKMSV